MSRKFEFKHDFFEKSMMGLTRYLNSLFKPYSRYLSQDFPIGIVHTGDEKYLFDQIYDGKIYDNVPRWSLAFAGLNTLKEENTNYHELGFFVALDENQRKREYGAPIQRITTEITFNTELLFSNIIEYLTFIEIYLTLTTIRHSFSFYHAGKRHIGIFELPEITDDEYNQTFGMTADKREHKLLLSFVLQLQFPAYQIYGIPGSSWEGNNGFDDPNNNKLDDEKNPINDGSPGNGQDHDGNENHGPIVNSEPMNAIVHHMHVENPEPEGIVSTVIVKKKNNQNT